MTGDHYFTAEPDAATAGAERTVEFAAGGHEFRLRASGGVFSAGRLDPGTAVLLRKADLPDRTESGALLDLGCGYGPIACVLATVAPSATVYAIDVNARARALAAANGAPLGVRVSDPEGVDDSVGFAQIWTNPPFRVGKTELHALLGRWLPRLAPDGVAWLVAGRHLGGDSLHRWLEDEGWQVTRHASQKGFRVLRVSSPGGIDAT
ncbi:16S RNA G1207 methylase RsmC [Asanoa ishikariensis]|uniref:class I SAM-dependent methyltransferase n=1 Tax=Asanoa ishikariensis TaxID=137265 RepID=UPI000B81D3E6|nr:methyltransferase [Asanoa ishikariensis]GIF65815.1 16S RNA G1207 methylase RsmC [Asanoa ishikariensis]